MGTSERSASGGWRSTGTTRDDLLRNPAGTRRSSLQTSLNGIVTLGQPAVVVLAFPIVVLILGLPIAPVARLVLALVRVI